MENERIFQMEKRERYQCLDTLRGCTLLSMILYHFIWDLVYVKEMEIAWFHSKLAYMGYGCLLDFAVLCQLIRHVRLISGFCSSGYDFAIPSSRPHLTVQTLGVALGFVGNCAPCGLSPQTDGMPVIRKKGRPRRLSPGRRPHRFLQRDHCIHLT